MLFTIMDIYGKGEQEDLSTDQKKYLRAYADGLKQKTIRNRGGESW